MGRRGSLRDLKIRAGFRDPLLEDKPNALGLPSNPCWTAAELPGPSPASALGLLFPAPSAAPNATTRALGLPLRWGTAAETEDR